MWRCLITGCGGFIGSYLAELLLKKGLVVYGLVHQHTENIDHLRDKEGFIICKGDIMDSEDMKRIVCQSMPDFVYHLAAQSLPKRSWLGPETTLKVNMLGTLHLLESIREADVDPVIEIVGSSAEYGGGTNQTPIKETQELKPSDPYGISKVAEDLLADFYWRIYKMKIIFVRPFHIIGPRKTEDVSSDFARGIVRVERGQAELLRVGNIQPTRDPVDVRDAVKAMVLLAEKGTWGEIYNLCSGKGYEVGKILNLLVSLSTHKVKVTVDKDRVRPIDQSWIVGDNSKLRDLGWEPEIPLEKSLADILDFWRNSPGE